MRATFGAAMAAIGAVLAIMLARGAAHSAPATAPASQPKKELTLDLGEKVTLKLVRIPAGKFLMGSPDTEKGHWPSEVQHEVTISKPFYLGISHVTVDQFATFAMDAGYKTDAEKAGSSDVIGFKDGAPFTKLVGDCSWRNPGFEQKGDHPVVQVSWNDATAFCDWLSKKSGTSVTLPTEAQWEYACRAGTKTAYPWGDNPDDGKGWANTADQSLKQKAFLMDQPFFSWNDGFVFTSPAGSFKPNAFGLYDMIGNAKQWCQDRFEHFDRGPTTDPTGAATGIPHVLRGGSWCDDPRSCRSAIRDASYPDIRDDCSGFRVSVAADAN